MKLNLVLIIISVAVASSRSAKRQDFSNDYYDAAESNNYENVEDAEALAADQQAAHSLIGGTQQQKAGFSQGSGLRSIAQGSADQANNAVLNQHAAANQAAYVAKNTLAQAANQVCLVKFQKKKQHPPVYAFWNVFLYIAKCACATDTSPFLDCNSSIEKNNQISIFTFENAFLCCACAVTIVSTITASLVPIVISLKTNPSKQFRKHLSVLCACAVDGSSL